ncbi:hypothetical protein E6P09_08965 [Haloferax mediterranei ATCC 33500]|uniref:Lipoprotein n=1 Tax=Haloferax mediterranei (strain ATCC 33500 / DSM 1411 / JCM 8866 / NBRC 14739 / NCIMB 2177 / R-4) TaxID=523841 RepID=I3R3U2_HALMT|nr:DUF5803 family protein [Haloferax mediterranei]AFK18902.1 hypothetical protein HFX_1189 [Haloferax mediterranei ATCC 33500]AHZ21733.1 hypothetical protein BM92_03250 [Haloferax mediterranei ATCC 33500]EMA03239.1 hypothetical protein C439_04555 [Haloferax mediterranei ATCC 33500]MDX5988996.1 DUF5803 family protein [Haloferax mediterranei ATCC 33500]QCQ75389.1 hypothetical protein E6P09_08965 [Haloferax mediterranei ATCC 33500]
MNKRLLVGIAGLALLLVTAGCLGGTSSLSNERLDAAPDGSYAWNAETDAHITVQNNSKFRAVYDVNSSFVELYRFNGFGSRTPLSVESVRYQYPNGTVVNGTGLKARGGDVTQGNGITNVTLPADANSNGKLAFTSTATPKRFSLPILVDGTYEVVLPPDRRANFPVFGSIRPRGYEKDIVDDQLHITWNEELTDGNVVVQFYLQRDLGIFGAVAAISVLVGGAGMLYYRRQIEALRERRQELGLDVENNDR